MDPVFNDVQGIYACPSFVVFSAGNFTTFKNRTFYLKETNIKVRDLHKVTMFGKCAFSFEVYVFPLMCERNFRVIWMQFFNK
jgi:hypothetical protein